MPKKKFVPPEFPQFILILGTPWEIKIKAYSEDPYFKKYNSSGYCSSLEHLIVVCDSSSWPGYQEESDELLNNDMKLTLRHEITHAFLYESGLADNSAVLAGEGWAKNEEMVDWFARQGVKIFMAWKKANCVDTIDPAKWTEWKNSELKK